MPSTNTRNIHTSRLSGLARYYPFGMQMQGREFASGKGYRYGFGSQESDNEVSGRGNSYTAEFWQYDCRLGRRWNVDPRSNEREWLSPYNYVQNKPLNRVDPSGALDAPIYDTDGNFIGTDDDGLAGQAIIMEKQNFKQGMSHSEALSKSKGYEGLISQTAKSRFNSHYKSLPSRPDYDGYLTLAEANDWYRNGNGAPLYTSLQKIDLTYIVSLGEGFVGQVKSFNLLLGSSSLNDGLVYGNITLKRYPNHSVRAFSDKYDFEMHNPWNPFNWVRNAETIIGKKHAGEGEPFEINIYGSKMLTPILPWIK
jgi:RHS repeat-associated protein